MDARSKEIVQFLTANTGPDPENACPGVPLQNLNSRVAKHIPGSWVCPRSALGEDCAAAWALPFPQLISIPQPTASKVQGKHPAMHLSSEWQGSGWWEGFLQLQLALGACVLPPWWFPGWQSRTARQGYNQESQSKQKYSFSYRHLWGETSCPSGKILVSTLPTLCWDLSLVLILPEQCLLPF